MLLVSWDCKFENLSKRACSCKFALLRVCFTGRRHKKKKRGLNREKKQKKNITVSSVGVNILRYLTTY